MTEMCESHVEEVALDWFEELGWSVLHACKESYHRNLLGHTTWGAPMNAHMRAHTQVCPYRPTEGPRPMNNVSAIHRRSIRLKDWDYSRTGMYFVTICAQNRVCLFGDVVNGDMRLNDAGRMVEKWWLKLNHKFPTVQTDQFVVIPNHVHGIIVIVGADLRVCPPALRVCPDDDQSNTGKHIGLPQQTHETGTHTDEGAHTGAPLPGIVQWFKTMTTDEYIRGVKQLGWPRFDRRLWQSQSELARTSC